MLEPADPFEESMFFGLLLLLSVFLFFILFFDVKMSFFAFVGFIPWLCLALWRYFLWAMAHRPPKWIREHIPINYTKTAQFFYDVTIGVSVYLLWSLIDAMKAPPKTTYREQEEDQIYEAFEDVPIGSYQNSENRYRQRMGYSDSSERDRSSFINEPSHGQQESHWFWAVLELDPNCTYAEAKRAYRQKSQQYHPDHVAHLGPKLQAEASVLFQEVREAWEHVERHFQQKGR